MFLSVFSYSHAVHLTHEEGSCPRLRNLSVQDAQKKLGEFHKGEGISEAAHWHIDRQPGCAARRCLRLGASGQHHRCGKRRPLTPTLCPSDGGGRTANPVNRRRVASHPGPVSIRWREGESLARGLVVLTRCAPYLKYQKKRLALASQLIMFPSPLRKRAAAVS